MYACVHKRVTAMNGAKKTYKNQCDIELVFDPKPRWFYDSARFGKIDRARAVWRMRRGCYCFTEHFTLKSIVRTAYVRPVSVKFRVHCGRVIIPILETLTMHVTVAYGSNACVTNDRVRNTFWSVLLYRRACVLSPWSFTRTQHDDGHWTCALADSSHRKIMSYRVAHWRP